MQAKCLYTYDPWDGSKGENFFISEYGQVVYQIKGNEVYKIVQAKKVPLHTHLTPDMGQKVKKNSQYGHVVHQIKGNEVYNNMQANSLPIHILYPWEGIKR